MSESMREEFESWLLKHKPIVAADMLEEGSFVPEWMFEAWQASRAALCVELPHFEQYDDDMVSGAATAINDCQDAIHAAGVKTR